MSASFFVQHCTLYKKDFFQTTTNWTHFIIRYGNATLLLFLQSFLGSVIGKSQIAPELFLNRLNISYGINYKYNGQLNHNIDRVWVVTKIKIPKYEEIKFPNISFDPECKFLESPNNGNTYRYIQSIKQLCRDSAPLINLFEYKENYKQRLIHQLLNEDLTLALKEIRLKYKEVQHFLGYPSLTNHLCALPLTNLDRKLIPQTDF